MSRLRLQCVVLVLSLLATAGIPSQAAAQFGKIKKALGDKAKASACVPDRPPTFIQAVGMTAAQMAAVNAGLDAEIAAAPGLYAQADKDQEAADKAMKQYEKDREAYDKASEKYHACSEKVQAEQRAASEEVNQRAEAATQDLQGEIDTTRMQDLATRAAAAAERVSQGKGTAEDRATMMEFQQMMSGVSAASAKVTAIQQEGTSHSERDAQLESACGTRPVEPTQPGNADLPGQKIKNAGAKKAGMSDAEYTLARETLLSLSLSNSVVKGSASGPPSDQDAEAMNQQIKITAQKICDMRKAQVPLF